MINKFNHQWKGLAVTFDNDNRVIPGFVFIRSYSAMRGYLNYLIATAAAGMNDMQSFAEFNQTLSPMKSRLLRSLPILPKLYADHNDPLMSTHGHTAKVFNCVHVIWLKIISGFICLVSTELLQSCRRVQLNLRCCCDRTVPWRHWPKKHY